MKGMFGKSGGEGTVLPVTGGVVDGVFDRGVVEGVFDGGLE